jgi:hypothetical protein
VDERSRVRYGELDVLERKKVLTALLVFEGLLSGE